MYPLALLWLLGLLPFLSSQLHKQPKQPFTVYIDATFDIFHAGHIAFLKKARKKAQEVAGTQNIRLVAGICSDEDVAQYKHNPYITLKDRVTVVKACRYVDSVIPNCPWRITEQFINHNNIDLVIHGDDYTPEQEEFCYSAAKKRGIFCSIPYTLGISTTDIVNRVQGQGVSVTGVN